MTAVTKKPFVSVVIPTYNRAWIVAEAVLSVLSQVDVAFELIVVDDGSTDNTEEILKPFKNSLLYIKQDNKGVSAARNKGVENAKGALIAFLDSDDYWLPGKLKHQILPFIEKPSEMINQTDEIWIRNGVRVNPKVKHKKPSGAIFFHSLHLCLVSPSAVMMRKTLFHEMNGFDESLPACEDYDLWLRISQKYTVSLIDKQLIVKRGGHEDQLSGAWGLDKYRIQSLMKLLKHNQLDDDKKQAVISVLKEKCQIYANGCLKREKKDEAEIYQNLMKTFTA